MKSTSILPALVFLLGFVRAAGAADYSFCWQQQQFGIVDTMFQQYETVDADGNFINPIGPTETRTIILFGGPLDYVHVRFTATQGLIGFCFVFATLVIVPLILTVRWRRRVTR